VARIHFVGLSIWFRQNVLAPPPIGPLCVRSKPRQFLSNWNDEVLHHALSPTCDERLDRHSLERHEVPNALPFLVSLPSPLQGEFPQKSRAGIRSGTHRQVSD